MNKDLERILMMSTRLAAPVRSSPIGGTHLSRSLLSTALPLAFVTLLAVPSTSALAFPCPLRLGRSSRLIAGTFQADL